jgi:hypothetical protein
MTESPLTVNEAFELLRSIRRRCEDINFKVITVDDIYSSLGLDEFDYEEEFETTLRNHIRNSWEMNHWSDTDMYDDDWEFFYGVNDELDKLFKSHGVERETF